MEGRYTVPKRLSQYHHRSKRNLMSYVIIIFHVKYEMIHDTPVSRPLVGQGLKQEQEGAAGEEICIAELLSSKFGK